MTQTNGSPANAGKGKAFFDRADQVAETGDHDYAIEMYVEGLKREPENLERGHKPLRDVSLRRKLKGGKPAGMMEKLQHRPGKDAVANLLNAEYLLAKDPGNLQQMVQVLKAARALGYPDLIDWLCDIVYTVQQQSKRSNRILQSMLVDSWEQAERYDKAIALAQIMLRETPDDAGLQERIGDLGAKQTLQKGRYGEDRAEGAGGGGQIHGIRDAAKQKELLERDSLTKSSSYQQQQLEKARSEYLADSSVSGKIVNYVDALLQVGGEDNEREAAEVLRRAYDETGNYQFKLRMGDILIRQRRRKLAEAREAGRTEAAKALAREALEFELAEYGERVVNYPTDAGLKFELGMRQLQASALNPALLDDAISMLQKATTDPRRRVQATSLLGQAFTRKEYYDMAINTLQRGLEMDLSEEQQKDLRYHLGDAFEKQGELASAQEQYSSVAQMDYDFRDVRDRLDQVRKQLQAQRNQG